MWPSHYYVAGMDRVRQELRRPAVWLIPLIVLGIQLVGSIGLVTAPAMRSIGRR
jgi:hypothetical protein